MRSDHCPLSMGTACFARLIFVCVLFSSIASCFSSPPLLGVHPLAEKYYAPEVINCKDGSKSFTRNRVNDNFCDCVDGTDEPGTSACPAGKFYCNNVGSTPKFIYSSQVNDRFCDCCDGSDEYDSNFHCPNTCVMGGNFQYKTGKYSSTVNNLDSADTGLKKDVAIQDESVHSFTALKVAIIVQVLLVSSLVILWIFIRHARAGKRRYR